MTNWKLIHEKLDSRIRKAFHFPLSRGSAKIIGAGYIGSTSHNTYVPPTNPDAIDDVDIFGIVLPPPDYLIGLDSWDHQIIKQEELDVVFFSYHKAVNLLLKANPNVFGFLWLRDEHYIIRTPAMERLIANRDAFSSQKAGHTFAGYARGQLNKMQPAAFEGYMGEKRKALVEKYGYDTKNAAHCLRILKMGIEFLNTGALKVYRDDDADFLRAVKSGAYTLDEIKVFAEGYFSLYDEARQKTKLPEEPNRKLVHQLTMDIVKEHICGRK